MSQGYTPAQKEQIKALWRANPTASNAVIATEASRLLGVVVPRPTVRRYKETLDHPHPARAGRRDTVPGRRRQRRGRRAKRQPQRPPQWQVTMTPTPARWAA